MNDNSINDNESMANNDELDKIPFNFNLKPNMKFGEQRQMYLTVYMGMRLYEEL